MIGSESGSGFNAGGTDHLVNNKGQLQLPCTDRLPGTAASGQFSAITLTSAIWAPGQTGTITVTFGTNECKQCSTKAAWSQIGSFSDKQEPSMNLGFIDPPFKSFEFRDVKYDVPLLLHRNYCYDYGNLPESCTSDPNETSCGCDPKWVPGSTVVHEFGHALGMMHEHQNNIDGKSPIHLNQAQIQATYEQTYIKDGETPDKARIKAAEDAATNVMDVYTCVGKSSCEFTGTTYDKNSVMLYKFPDSWIVGYGSPGFVNPTNLNFQLSETDKAWLRSKYPLNAKPRPEITVEFIDPDVELWKTKWVEKVVTETYGPLIGVNWKFQVRGSVAETPHYGKESAAITYSSTSTAQLSPAMIALIVVGVVMVLLVIAAFVVVNKRSWKALKTFGAFQSRG